MARARGPAPARRRAGRVARRLGRVALVAGGAALVACAAAPGPSDDDLVRAVTRFARLEYEARAGDDPGGARAAARAAVDRALAACDLALPPPGADLRAVVAAARPGLAARDVVVLPPPLTAGAGAPDAGPADADPGVALARVVGRAAGLSREVAGRVVRYRRVEHAGVLVPDFAAWAALRAGRPAWTPLGRAAGPTVFVDVAAVARRAGRGPFAGLDAAGLAAAVDGWQAAYLRFAPDAGAAAARGEPALARLHTRALLAALAQDPPRLPLAAVRALAAGEEPGAPPELAGAARAVIEALAGEGADGGGEAEGAAAAARRLAADAAGR